MRLPPKPRSLKGLNKFCEDVIEYLRMVTVTSVSGGTMKRSSSGTTIEFKGGNGGGGSVYQFVPFWTSVRQSVDIDDLPILLLSMVQGYIVLRTNTGDAAGMLEVTNIPTEETVEVGDKVYCEITEDIYGNATAAAIGIASSWPASTAPSLIGGDESGTGGTRYIRISEIVQESGEKAKSKRLLTGHIDHFQPGFVNNLMSGYTSGEGANILARYTDGEWKLRGLSKASGGLTITETADEIEITGNGVSGENGAVTVDDGLVTEVKEFTAGSFAHPWKVTDGGGGNAAIAAGFILGHYFNYYTAALGTSTGDGTFGPDEITLGPGASYAGGTQAISGTQYIYAEIPSNDSSLEYTETQGSDLSSIVLIETTDKTEPLATDTATIAVSTLAPGTYAPTAGKAATCIAKVTNVTGVISITQYVTHNPTMFIPINNISVGDTT